MTRHNQAVPRAGRTRRIPRAPKGLEKYTGKYILNIGSGKGLINCLKYWAVNSVFVNLTHLILNDFSQICKIGSYPFWVTPMILNEPHI